ncbi:MAG TPA: methylaspartate mutase [Campylobacterales bacterium]|nr:methylaspartate mutase [Campylobacterales bacterium]
MSKLLIDVGSTYFKASSNGKIEQFFRNFDKTIEDDLKEKCGELIAKFEKEDIHICSSANGGLSTLIIGVTNSFSLKFATNIAYNSGINIIDTILFSSIKSYAIPAELIDVVIIVGGIDSVSGIFDEKLLKYLKNINYSNIVYVGSALEVEFMRENIENIVILDNIVNNRLQVEEEGLKHYLTNLYQSDIIGKEDIKELYHITANQIYSTPYIVNSSLESLHKKFDVVDPFILIDIGGATTDIHYGTDLVHDNLIQESGYDRLVLKKLGVYKSRDSLVFAAKNNEFVYELLNLLNVTENILEEKSENATKILMQLSIFLVLYKVSSQHEGYITLDVEKLNSIVFTGGITKVLSFDDVELILNFFYKKILGFHQIPTIIIDTEYKIWTIGVEDVSK